jgi:radical SAM protein with 4Fe4S-binding SPASM domain
MDISKLTAVEIEINSHCNKACSYCPNSIDERIEKGTMSPEVYETLIGQLKDIQFKGRISFDFYNEPMLCRHLDQFVELTMKELPQTQIHLYTNGSLLTTERFRKLSALGIARFIVTKHEDSFDGKAFPFDKTWQELTSAEKSLTDYRPFDELALTNRGGSLAHIKSPVENVQTYPCFIPTMMLTVTVLGTIVPCFEDFYQKHAMGNIMEEHLRDIWNKPEYQIMRKALMLGNRERFEVCANCTRTQVKPEGKFESL